MKKNYRNILLFVILGAFLFSSCQEKIYGQTKRRKKRNCGCELIKTPPKMDAYAYTENTK